MRITVSIPEAIGREAEEAAHEEGVSISALYARAVERYLSERRREQAITRINALGRYDMGRTGRAGRAYPGAQGIGPG